MVGWATSLPNEHRFESSESALDVLKSQGGFDTKTVRAIRNILESDGPGSPRAKRLA